MNFSTGASVGLVGFLFGIFCAYWAQTTNRNAWLWFFFGWVLAPVAGLVLLWKNSASREPEANRLDDPGRPDLMSVRKDVV